MRKIKSFTELYHALRGSSKAEAIELAKANSELRCSYSSTFCDEYIKEQAEAGNSEGVLGNNYVPNDLIDIANMWKRACKHF